MIILHKIRYQNFLSTGNLFTEIELDITRNTLIVGTNGAGKSTMMDALCFVLYGKPFRNINKPQLINSITGKNLLVELEFSVDQQHYLIRRGIKPSVFEIYKNGQFIEQSAESKDFQLVIDKTIMKINYKAFCQRVILGSANFTPFMQLTAAARRNFIEDLLDIQIFTTMNNILKETASQNKNSIVEIDNQINVCKQVIEANQVNRKKMQQQAERSMEQFNAQIQSHQHSNKQLNENNEQLEQQINSLRTQIQPINDLKQKIKKATTAIAKLQTEKQQQINEIEFYSNSSNCSTCHQPIDTEFKISRIDLLQNKIDQTDCNYAKIQTLYDQLQQKLQAFEQTTQQINQFRNQQQANNATIIANNKVISSLQRQMQQTSSAQIIDDTEYKVRIEQLEQQRKILIDQRELNNIALLLLRDDGIKTQIVKQYIPLINNLINYYLDVMGFFCKFEIDENFEESIKSRHRDDFSYSSFSEGEKTRIDLALLFTWREIAKIRNYSSINLLILDEVMDGSLDSFGTDEFLSIISRFTKENNVFIISHKTDQIMDKFDRTIKFEKIKNFSQIAKEIK